MVQTFYSYLLAVEVTLWLAERAGEAAVESEAATVLVGSQGSRGAAASKSATVGRTEAEGTCSSALPMRLLCSADHPPPAV